jgi:hypothetical protein
MRSPGAILKDFEKEKFVTIEIEMSGKARSTLV